MSDEYIVCDEYIVRYMVDTVCYLCVTFVYDRVMNTWMYSSHTMYSSGSHIDVLITHTHNETCSHVDVFITHMSRYES